MPPAPRPPPAERRTAARNLAIASIVVITTRPRCRLPNLSTWYAIRRIAACQVSAARKKQADAALPARLLLKIAVNDFGGIAALGKRLCDGFSKHDGAVLPAGATKGDGEITFSLADVMRDQTGTQAFDAPQKLTSLRKRSDIPPHFRILAGERPQPGHEMRVG